MLLKKLFSFTFFIAIIVVFMHLHPSSTEGNRPGAGDIWWANVTEINESYQKISQK